MTEPSRIRDLEFSDLCLGHPGIDARYSKVSGAALGPLPTELGLKPDLDRLIVRCDEALQEAADLSSFKVCHDEVSYRVVAIPTSGGRIFLLRRLDSAVNTLAGLGIPHAYGRRMLTRHLSGLFVICGEPSSGRTMTACAMLKERLQIFGGLGVTGEDPIELPLEGEHGNGICFQTTVSRDPQRFSDAFNRLLRSSAQHILIDEVTTPEAASAVLQASVGGPVLIVTMQAEDVIQCVIKLHAMASEKMAPDNARALLAEGLAGVLRQQLTGDAKSRLKLEAEFLCLNDAPMPRSLLRRGEYEHLASFMQQQMTAMIAESAAVSRVSRS